VNRWWSGGYVVDQPPSAHAAPTDGAPHRGGPDVFGLDLGKVKIGVVGNFGRRAGAPRPAGMPARSAREQLASARERARAARERAQSRMRDRRRGSPGDFKTLNAGVAIAVLLFFAIIGGLAMLLFAVGKPSLVRVAATPSDGATPGVAYAYGDLDAADGATVAAASTKNGKTPRGSAMHPRIVINGHEVGGGTSVPDVKDVAEGEQVLVISDIQPTTPAINAAIDRLKAAGFVVLGNYPGNNSEEVDLQQQLDLEVSAKAARGLGQLDSDDVSSHLSDWVTAHPDLALLVWFTRTDPNTQAVKFSVIAPRSHSEDSRAVFQAATHTLRP
jgi:glutaredoxin